MDWNPKLGACPQPDGTRFQVWAPDAGLVEVILEKPPGPEAHSLRKRSDGRHVAMVPGVASGDRYRYRVDGRGPFPDPASRFQPEGVHGPSEVVDPRLFRWTDRDWKGIDGEALVLYELHVGTFTPEGTFRAAAERLEELRELGVTAVEIMPVADFPGTRNWGYDGVDLFAPARCYGAPDDLRRLVDEAHQLGLAVHLDVVYNHLGPDGAYLGAISPHYFSTRHKSPWGAGINFDGEHSAGVRNFFVENALHWIHEYHVDGLRLDATHAIVDESPRHFLAELAAGIRDSLKHSPRKALVIAEDVRNLAVMLKPEQQGGWGLDAVWSDDFHHQMRRCLAGDRDGYFADFEGATGDIALTAKKGWFYCGQQAKYFGAPRGTEPDGLPPKRFVFFIQNHDQVGNRAMGDRLHHKIDLAAYRAASAFLLLCPQPPLLFMGQEWAAATPFQYFTDHHEELGKLVTQGRRSEFQRFATFADPTTWETIPDPQDPTTFENSCIRWEERTLEPHASVLRLYRRLLELRRSRQAPRSGSADGFEVAAADEDVLLLRRANPGAPPVLAAIRLRGAGRIDLRGSALADPGKGLRWEPVLTTEDKDFAVDPQPPEVGWTGGRPVVSFARPGALVWSAVPEMPKETA